MQRLVDIHNHIIFDVDDGPGTIEQSMEMMRQAVKNNITDIVATPHQLENDQVSEHHERQNKVIENFKILQKAVKEEGLPLNLYLGGELYYTTYVVHAPEIPYFTYENEKKYALIEFSLNWHPEGYKEIFYDLIQNNVTPVLAHPERYSYFWEIIEDIIDLIKMGTILQINAGSLLGYQGTQARFLSEMLLREGLAHIIASDAHRARRAIGFNMPKAAEVFKEKYPKIDFNKLISENPLKIIQGEPLYIDEDPCYNFDKNKQYKLWRRFYFLHDVLGIGNKIKKRKKKVRRYI
ncbi:MAG: CpsB/CapC family capsule biosynthesis tyrosine phosphatase [Candidatus Marinimicrobia bacterium]|nr:CpsB/CapC family capsule biosynthesis tyrosine phosphatase [Candidatus Neomarinimicrobiota bacterium]